MHRTALEIGLFETARNLVRAGNDEGLTRKIEAAMPLPKLKIHDQIEAIAEWLLKFGKKKYMFLTPEIALIEAMGRKAAGAEALLVIPCDMVSESHDRLRGNLPHEMKVSVTEEPYFPENFLPENGIIVVCGYTGGGRNLVMSETYRLIEHYGNFYGRQVFIPYITLDHCECCDGWKQSTRKFDEIWRNA